MCLAAQHCQQFAFQFNGIHECATGILLAVARVCLRKWVLAPGFGVAVHKCLGVCIQKK